MSKVKIIGPKARISVRVHPSILVKIIKQYGSFTAFVNAAINKLIKE